MNKIAILGDIHFGELARSREFCPNGIKLQDITHGAASIKQGIVDIIKDENVDYLFIAGDLTSTGSPIEYTECYNVILSIAEEAGISKNKIIVCLGNHDVDWRISDIAETYTGLDAKFPADQNRKLYQKMSAKIADILIDRNDFFEKGPAPFSGILNFKDLIIFVLNSGWQSSRSQKIPHGKIDIEQLNWFKDQAKNYQEKEEWKILLLHHHPHNYPNLNPFHDTSLLEEGSEIIEIAGKCGFNLICHGHRHHPKALNNDSSDWLNPITFICAGSCSVNASHRNNGDIPNCFHIIELFDEERIIRLKNYEYSPNDGWKALANNRPEAPLDNDMFFCKTYTYANRSDVLKKIVGFKKNKLNYKLPEWIDLPIELKTLDYKSLNKLIRDIYYSQFQVYGNYPNEVALLRRSK